MSRRVERVAIVGADAAAWLTALSLMRTLGRTGLSVHVVEIGSMLTPVDAYATLPSLANMHELLGLEENDLLAASQGVHAYGQRFANWSRAGAPFVHAYDSAGEGAVQVEFVDFWLRARAEGMNVALEDFSLGAAAAKQNRYVMQSEESERFSRAAYGYHLDAIGYVRAVRRMAIGLGVSHQQSGVAEVRRAGERIVSLRLNDGSEIEADLYIDASGARAVLIGEAPGAGFERWEQWFGCDRVLAASGKRLSPLPAFAQIAAFRAGWIGMYPLQDRTAVAAVYSSRDISDEEMVRNASVLSGLALGSDAVRGVLAPGLRRKSWVGNCVAVGEAAVSFEPLDATHLHALQLGVSHLVAQFPVDADNMVEAKVFNASVAAHADNVRDFQIAHYKLNQRVDEPFWDRARQMAVPASLAYKLNLFSKRARAAVYDHETFEEASWTALMIGHGLMPAAYSPLADGPAPAEMIQRFKDMLGLIGREVRDMPSLEAHLEMHMPVRKS